jgi:transposase
VNDQEITLTIQQSQKYQLLKAALDGHATNAQAAGALGLSVRQVQRYKRRLERLGPAGVRHGNAGRQPANKLPEPLRHKILQLASTTYADYNFSHMADVLPIEQGIVISDETLRRLLRPQGHGNKPRRGRVHRKRRQRRKKEGELLFLDGSPHHWFGPEYEPVCLLLSTDDATGKPLCGKFQPQEDRDGCLEVCYRTFLKHGLPLGYYLDRASQFITTDHLAAKEGRKLPPTAFQIAMDTLNIELIFANSPQARGRGERINGSFQNRLVAELVRYGIHDCKRATRYLNQVFIPRYAKRFGRPAADSVPAWRTLNPELNLPAILCAKHQRIVSNDNTVSFAGVVYQIEPPAGRRHLVHAKIEVQQRFDGSIHLVHPKHGELPMHKIARRKELLLV